MVKSMESKDIKIENQDIVLNPNGSGYLISGIDKAIQQIQIGATVKKGKFIIDTNLGVNIDNIDIESKDALKNIEAVIKEAIINVPNIAIKANEIIENGNKVAVNLTVNDGSKSKDIEVTIYG